MDISEENSHHDALRMVDWANQLLSQAGFERVAVSRYSEATYWRWPGRGGVIRVSCHRGKGERAGLDAILARVTFRGGKSRRHVVYISRNRATDLLAMAIGRYMMKSSGVVMSTYDGPRDGRKLTLMDEISP